MNDTKRGRLLYATIALTSAGVFIGQIVISIVFGLFTMYDFRFLSAPFALLGLGLGGVAVSLLYNNIKTDVPKSIAAAAGLYLFSVLVLFVTARGLPHMECSSSPVILTLLMCSFFNFFSAGIMMSLLFIENRAHIFIMSFFDYIGCALAGIALLFITDTYGLYSFLYLLLAIGSAVYGISFIYVRRKAGVWVMAVLCCTLLATSVAVKNMPLFPLCGKGTAFFEKSNSFSYLKARLVSATREYTEYLISLTTNNTWTNAFVAPDIESLRAPLTDFRYIPFAIQASRSVLVIGSGAGSDIYRALLSGSKDITAIEINPLLIEFMNKFSGDNGSSPYQHTFVKTVIAEARSSISGRNDMYDLIIIAFSKSFGRPIGAQLFQPKYLYTLEAFSEYMDKLHNGGILAIIDRLHFTRQYVTTLTSLLLSRGLDPNNHIILLTNPESVGNLPETVLFKKNGFSEEEKTIIRKEAEKNNLLFSILSDNQHTTSSETNIITDDKPFIWQPENNYHPYWFPKESIIRDLLVIGMVFVGIIAITIFLFFKRTHVSHETVSIPFFFVGISIGLSSLEFVLLHKITLLLGNPVYSHVIILSSILIFSGIGSLVASLAAVKRHFSLLSWILVIMLCFYYFGIDYCISLILPMDYAAKALISVVLLIPASLFAGALFPIALDRIGKRSPALLPWSWGIDALAFVTASLIISYIVLFTGIKLILIFGVIGYAIAAVSSRHMYE